MKKIFSITIIAAITIFTACTKGSKVDRTHAPAAGPAPKIQIGQYQTFQLDNGLKVIVVENHKLPRVSYSINLDIDPVLEGAKSGYVSMAGDLMSAGTKTKSKAQIDEAVDFMGASLNTSATGVFGNCLKKHSSDFLALMSDAVLNPSFPQEELDKNVKSMQSALSNEKTDPDAMSTNIGSVMNYGRNHPYGEVPTEASVVNITRNDLIIYYNTYFQPQVAYLVIVGDITLDEAKAQSQQYFSGWKKGNVSEKKYTSPKAPEGNRVAFVPFTGAVQSVIDITYPLDLQPGTPDAIVAGVLNNVLGGNGFQTRLMQNLREDKAYTYGAYSAIAPDEVIGNFSAGASVRNEVTDSAITQIFVEMQRLVDEPVADSTLIAVKSIMTGSFARSLERPQTIANFALNIEKYHLPKDYYETYLQKLNAVTAADIQAMAKRVIKPQNANITVVGNREIAPKLAQFAKSGKVEFFNADGTEFVDIKPAPAGVTAQTVIDKYIAAMGGREAFAKVKSFEENGKMSMGPMSADVNIKVKDAKFKMAVSMSGMELMKQVSDGKKGSMAQMGQTEPMEAADIRDTQMQLDLLAELNYAKYGVTTTLKGIDKLNNEDVYVVERKSDDGSIATDYYSVATGLKMKSQRMDGEGAEATLAETIYLEYATVNGMKYVSKMSEAAGPQQVEFTFSEMKINPKIDDKEFTVASPKMPEETQHDRNVGPQD